MQRANNDLRCLMAVSRARRRAKASEAPRAREPSETRRRCSNGVLDADAHQAGSVDCDHSIVHGKHICTSYRSNLSRTDPTDIWPPDGKLAGGSVGFWRLEANRCAFSTSTLEIYLPFAPLRLWASRRAAALGPWKTAEPGLSARAALKARDGRVPSTSYAALLVRDRCGCPARGKRAQTVTVGANSLVY